MKIIGFVLAIVALGVAVAIDQTVYPISIPRQFCWLFYVLAVLLFVAAACLKISVSDDD